MTRTLSVLGFLALLAEAASPAQSQGLTQFSLYRSNENQQTDPTTVTPFNGGTNYFFTSRGFEQSVNDFSAMTTTAPNGIVYTNGPAFTGNGGLIEQDYQTGYLTKSAMDAAFSAGTYTLNASGPGGTVTASQVYNGTDHYAAPPQLTAATFNALNGLNPNSGFTFSFLPFVHDPAANTFGTFFQIVDVNTNAVVFNTFTFSSVSSFFVPANTLLPSTQYTDELIFSNRIDGAAPTNGSSCVSTSVSLTCPSNYELSWDSRTFSDFTTGVAAAPGPIPGAGLLSYLALGLLGLGSFGWKRFKQGPA
jgi:hypothetical protein